MSNAIAPIPQDQIGENFRWRDWFTKLGAYVNTLSTGGSGPSGLGTMAYEDADNVVIIGGGIANTSLINETMTNSTIDNTAIGNNTPSTGKFTTLEASTSLKTDSLTGYLYGHGSGGVVTASTTIPVSALAAPPYGAFSSTQTQTVSTINTPTRVTFDTTDYSNGISYTVGDGLHVTTAGLYNVQFSVQATNSYTQPRDADIWIRKGSGAGTATDLANTASVFTVEGTHGGQPGYCITAANFFIRMAANDFIEFWWSTNDTSVQLNYLPAITTPFTSPGAPSIIVTFTYVGP